jgi:hypothetical protein
MKCAQFVSCSKDYNNSLLAQSIKRLRQNVKIQINEVGRDANIEGLSKTYNRFLKSLDNKDYVGNTFGSKYDYLIFVHDDVYIDDLEIFNKLDEAFKQYDIVGLAGGLEPEIKPLCLWHHMCKRENWRGRVGHFDDKGNKFITDFGKTPSRVCVLDGLFLAVNLKKVRETSWKFNETDCGKFHLYDIASSLDANAAGLKLGVWPILVYHHSPGLRDINDPSFQESQKKFLAKYS